MNGLRNETVVFHVPGLGNVVAVLPQVPEDAPFKIREGIARRRIAAVSGVCPCGSRLDYFAGVTSDGVNVGEVRHDRRCPADTDRLTKAIRRWTR